MATAFTSLRVPCAHKIQRNVTVRTSAMSDPLVKPSAPGAAAAAPAKPLKQDVSIEYQRQQAKAMQQYFKSLKQDEGVQESKVFGWTKRNEINNGRWVMMGLAIGMLTEYATGVNFPNQLGLMASYLGVVDLYD